MKRGMPFITALAGLAIAGTLPDSLPILMPSSQPAAKKELTRHDLEALEKARLKRERKSKTR